MVTEQEARDMWAAIESFQKKDENAVIAAINAKRNAAQTWFDLNIKVNYICKPTDPITKKRIDSETDINYVKSVLSKETDKDRIVIIKQELNTLSLQYHQIKAGEI